jgi:hypothetical protein
MSDKNKPDFSDVKGGSSSSPQPDFSNVQSGHSATGEVRTYTVKARRQPFHLPQLSTFAVLGFL